MLPLPTHPKNDLHGEKLTYYLLSCFLLISNTYYPPNPGWGPLVAPLRGARFRASAPKSGLPSRAFANLQRARGWLESSKKLPEPVAPRIARGPAGQERHRNL